MLYHNNKFEKSGSSDSLKLAGATAWSAGEYNEKGKPRAAGNAAALKDLIYAAQPSSLARAAALAGMSVATK